jgi:hypothetical protein
VIAENRPGEPTFAYISALSGGTISDLDGSRIRSAAAGAGGAVTVRFSSETLEVPTTWAGVPTSFSAGGLTPFGHALKPDVMGPGAQVLSSTFPSSLATSTHTRARRHELLGAARRRRRSAPRPSAIRRGRPQQMKSALMSTAGPAFADTTLTQEASVLVQGPGSCDGQRGQAARLHRPAVALVRLSRRGRRRELEVHLRRVSDAGDGRARGSPRCSRRSRPPVRRSRRPPSRSRRAERR